MLVLAAFSQCRRDSFPIQKRAEVYRQGQVGALDGTNTLWAPNLDGICEHEMCRSQVASLVQTESIHVVRFPGQSGGTIAKC